MGLHGQVVHVEPMKSKVKAPGTKRLKLKYDNPRASFAFKSNSRRYSTVCASMKGALGLHEVSWVGRCRLNQWNPC